MADAGSVRSFIAIELAGDARPVVAAYLDRLRAIDGVAWTAAANLHVTLKFLGSVTPTRLEALAPRLATVAAARPPFVIECGGVGAFPSLARPRVLWVGTHADELGALAAAVDAAGVIEGFPAATRPFHGHCTLGRVRPGGGRGRGSDRARLARLLDALGPDDPHPFGISAASELVLFRSDTGPRGARYTALATFPMTR